MQHSPDELALLLRYTDASGHEHVPAGSPEGGQFTGKEEHGQSPDDMAKAISGQSQQSPRKHMEDFLLSTGFEPEDLAEMDDKELKANWRSRGGKQAEAPVPAQAQAAPVADPRSMQAAKNFGAEINRLHGQEIHVSERPADPEFHTPARERVESLADAAVGNAVKSYNIDKNKTGDGTTFLWSNGQQLGTIYSRGDNVIVEGASASGGRIRITPQDADEMANAKIRKALKLKREQFSRSPDELATLLRYAKDASGHEHKGKGPGGGQFTGTGEGQSPDAMAQKLGSGGTGSNLSTSINDYIEAATKAGRVDRKTIISRHRIPAQFVLAHIGADKLTSLMDAGMIDGESFQDHGMTPPPNAFVYRGKPIYGLRLSGNGSTEARKLPG